MMMMFWIQFIQVISVILILGRQAKVGFIVMETMETKTIGLAGARYVNKIS
ncbi:hypothetical protein THIOSC15_1120006 [uncultured Thiomicrorhabdus sp.]